MTVPRILKVFVASPDDVAEERNTLAKLLADINDVLAYLTPEKGLSLELVRYETHSYPDIGAPQEVINREIPVDYDIFVGIMWKRAGTPTATTPAGTIEEFNRACERRKQGSLPRIMFYFCDQPIPVPTATELQQLAESVKFRSQLASEGLTASYPSHAEFGDHVRGGLLRAIRDILNETDSRRPYPRLSLLYSRPWTPPASRRPFNWPRNTMRYGKDACRRRANTHSWRRVFSNEDFSAESPRLPVNLSTEQLSGRTADGHRRPRHVPRGQPSRMARGAHGPRAGEAVCRLSRGGGVAGRGHESPIRGLCEVRGSPRRGEETGSPAERGPGRLNVLARCEEELARKCQNPKG